MSRIGKKPVEIPKDVTATIEGRHLRVKGPKGELSLAIHPVVKVGQENADNESTVVVSVNHPDDKTERALWGLFRALIQNMMIGVTKGFSRQLEVNGVGYRVAQSGSKLKFEVGFSHPVEFTAPSGVVVAVEKNVITVSGIDKQLVNEVAAQIRKIKPPEPYKGKGIKYVDEVVRRKAGKAVKGASAG